jgi:hypothetical protein
MSQTLCPLRAVLWIRMGSWIRIRIRIRVTSRIRIRSGIRINSKSGSASTENPDPHQRDADPQQCFTVCQLLKKFIKKSIEFLTLGSDTDSHEKAGSGSAQSKKSDPDP